MRSVPAPDGRRRLADFEATYTPDADNRESKDEPADTRGTGPAAFYAPARWLRGAFSELAREVHDAAQDGDLVVLHTTMTGRQTGPFVAYGPQARVEMVFPPKGRRFAVTQTHWFRVHDGQVAEHWANRDDLGMGEQLGRTPPGHRSTYRACCGLVGRPGAPVETSHRRAPDAPAQRERGASRSATCCRTPGTSR